MGTDGTFTLFLLQKSGSVPSVPGFRIPSTVVQRFGGADHHLVTGVQPSGFSRLEKEAVRR
jgi:hypothetical protein